MRLIDADELLKKMDIAIAMMERTMIALDIEDDAEAQMELKAYKDIRNGINDEPTVHPESNWISCKERLPENYVDVLVWFEYYRYGSYNRLYRTHGIGTYSENYDSWTINHESGWHKLRVIAWMPLPEPYKEEGDKDGR